MTNHPIFYSEYKYRLKYDMYMYLGTVCLKLYENRNVTDYSIFRYIPSKNKNDRTHIFLANTTAAAKKMQHLFICVGFLPFFVAPESIKYILHVTVCRYIAKICSLS